MTESEYEEAFSTPLYLLASQALSTSCVVFRVVFRRGENLGLFFIEIDPENKCKKSYEPSNYAGFRTGGPERKCRIMRKKA